MKLIKYLFTLSLIFGLCEWALPQDADTGKWIRVQTDNGEVSIDIPQDYAYFFDKSGFYVSTGAVDYPLSDVSFIRSYRDGTLISFEAYRADPDALDPLIRTSARREAVRWTEFNGIKVKEVSGSDAKRHYISLHFRSKKFIYVVSSASRAGETPFMKRFLQSLRFVPDSKEGAPDVAKLSSLSPTPVNLKTKDVAPLSPSSKTPDRDEKPLIVIFQPRASYIDAARNKNVQGSVRLRIEFAKNGYIPSIEVLETLPQGMFRQALFAALRIKFLPAEKNGEPITTTSAREYTFTIH